MRSQWLFDPKLVHEARSIVKGEAILSLEGVDLYLERGLMTISQP